MINVIPRYEDRTGRTCPSDWSRLELPIRIFDPLLRVLTVHATHRGHGCSRGRRRTAAEPQKIPVHEMCRRNGSLKHKRRSFGIWGPCCWQNILNFVCTQSFGYKTLVFGFIEPLRRHVCGWLGLAGASRRESGSGWVSCRHDGLRAVRNQRS